MTDTPENSENPKPQPGTDTDESPGEPRSNLSSDDRTSSNGIFFAIIAFIVLGTAGWYALTLIGSEPVGVERAKELAAEFERECFIDLQDDDRCRELIGAHHRDCLFDNLERVPEGEGDDGSGVRHDREGYLTCMRDQTGVGRADGDRAENGDSEVGEP